MSDLSDVECPHCKKAGYLKIEIREKYHTRPIGTFSLAGNTLKVSADKVPWPVLTCKACGFEEEGKL